MKNSYTIYLEVCEGLHLEDGGYVSIDWPTIDVGLIDLYVNTEEDEEIGEELRSEIIDRIDSLIDVNKIFIRISDNYFIITNFPEKWGRVDLGENTGRTRNIICDLTKEDTIKWIKDIQIITYSEAVEKKIIKIQYEGKLDGAAYKLRLSDYSPYISRWNHQGRYWYDEIIEINKNTIVSSICGINSSITLEVFSNYLQLDFYDLKKLINFQELVDLGNFGIWKVDELRSSTPKPNPPEGNEKGGLIFKPYPSGIGGGIGSVITQLLEKIFGEEYILRVVLEFSTDIFTEKGKKATKQWWEKASEDDRERAIDNLDEYDGERYEDIVRGKWENLESWMQRDMYIVEAEDFSMRANDKYKVIKLFDNHKEILQNVVKFNNNKLSPEEKKHFENRDVNPYLHKSTGTCLGYEVTCIKKSEFNINDIEITSFDDDGIPSHKRITK